jgi:hypothetical protein
MPARLVARVSSPATPEPEAIALIERGPLRLAATGLSQS